MQLVTQPLFGEVRLGEYLLGHLADPQWTVFRAAVAFVKLSGTQYLRQGLREFSGRAQVKISVGVDLYGSSKEGLHDLMEAVPHGEIFVYRNNRRYTTFHPKMYVFKSAKRADVLVGSGNLTGGGLFTNCEASLAASLDLAVSEDAAFLQTVEATLDGWSRPQRGVCYVLTPGFLDQLVAGGLVRSEAQIAAMQRAADAYQPPSQQPEITQAMPPGAALAPVLFTGFAVPLPPRVPDSPTLLSEEVTEIESEAKGIAVGAARSGTPSLVISVLLGDLHDPGSSNEIRITKYIRDAQPKFWGWSSEFEGPDAMTGQYKRSIHVGYGGRLINAYLKDFPGRKPDGTKASADFRLGSIAPIVADLRQEDDLLILSLSPELGIDYFARVVRAGDAEHEHLVNGLQPYRRSQSATGTYRKFRYST